MSIEEIFIIIINGISISMYELSKYYDFSYFPVIKTLREHLNSAFVALEINPTTLAAGMAGINQSIMLSLSMVVIASLVGAPGLGAEVYRAVSRLEVGTGFEAGISIVILAIILDRITQYFGNRSNQRA